MNKTNTNLTFMGNPLKVVGKAATEGTQCPAFTLTGNGMEDVTQAFIAGKTAILMVVPSLDTPVCSIEVKKFAKEAAGFQNVVLLAVSEDLPFAQKRWCTLEAVGTNTSAASDYKYRSFGEAFGCWLPDVALLARSVFVVDAKNTIRHVEYVTELSTEPDYAAAIEAVRVCQS